MNAFVGHEPWVHILFRQTAKNIFFSFNLVLWMQKYMCSTEVFLKEFFLKIMHFSGKLPCQGQTSYSAWAKLTFGELESKQEQEFYNWCFRANLFLVFCEIGLDFQQPERWQPSGNVFLQQHVCCTNLTPVYHQKPSNAHGRWNKIHDMSCFSVVKRSYCPIFGWVFYELTLSQTGTDAVF